MPETTLTGWKRRITEYAAEHDITLGASKVQRLAGRIHKRAVQYADVDLHEWITYNDPTPRKAFRNIEDAQAA